MLGRLLRGRQCAQLWSKNASVRFMSVAAAGGELERFFLKHELQYPLFPPNPEVESSVEPLWKKMDNPKAEIGLTEFVNEGNTLTKDMINSLLVKFCSRQKFMAAYIVSRWVLQNKPYELTSLELESFIHFACYLRKTDKAISPFKSMAEKSAFAYENMLRGMANGNNVAVAVSMFDDMRKSKLVTTTEPYNRMICMYFRDGRPTEAAELLAEMKSSGIEPDTRTYRIILDYKNLLDKEETSKYEEELKAHLSKIGDAKLKGMDWKDTIVLQALLKRSSHVERLWKDMEEEGPVPTHYYFSAMEAFAMLGDIAKVEELSGIVKDEVGTIRMDHGVALIMAYSMNGMMDKAEAVFQGLGSEVNAKMYNFMIIGYMEAGNVEKGLEKLQEVRTKGDGFKPSMNAMLSAFKAFAASKDIEAAEDLAKEIKLGSYKTNASLFNGLLRVYIASSKTEVPRLTERATKIRQNDETIQLLSEVKDADVETKNDAGKNDAKKKKKKNKRKPRSSKKETKPASV